MKISQWLVNSMVRLKEAGVPNGRTDCLVLLTDLLNVDKSWVHTHPEHELDDLQYRELEHRLVKRLEHIPLAYIRGFIEFYGRKFTVNSRVLIPRPESESFIDLLKELDLRKPAIADIGTGSGCLGISAALEIPDTTVHLYDIDSDALAIANHNARHYDLKLQYYPSDLLENLRPPYDVLLANLPYVPETLITSPEITKEPALALFSGKDGLDHYRKFWQQVAELEIQPQYILTESLEDQHEALHTLAQGADYRHLKTDVLVSVYVKN